MSVQFRWLFLVALVSMITGTAVAGSTPLKSVSEEGLLVFESEDGMFKWWTDTRVYLDAAFYDEDESQMGSGTKLRRGRMAWKAILYRDWYAEFDFDLSEEHVEVKDAYIRYDNIFDRNGYVRYGNFREPFGLEENTTSRYLLFMERSQGTEMFVPGRRMGIEFACWDSDTRFAGGVFGPDIEDFETTDESQALSFTGRFSLTAVNDCEKVFHTGIAMSRRKTNFDNGYHKFKTNAETHVYDPRWMEAKIYDIDYWNLFGLEAAYCRGPMLLQAEHMSTRIYRNGDLPLLDYSGGYVSASFFLTNDTHPYLSKAGEFGRVIPTNKSAGAWEVSGRWGSVDFNDEDQLFGSSSAFTLGLTWYANPVIKMYANFTQIDNGYYAVGDGHPADDNFNILQFRLMAAF